MTTFGRTWWGQQWLAAFDGIDDHNRLPRGRRYAGNGSVREINIAKDGVYAKVQGSRRQPYAVNVALAPFAGKTQRLIVNAVQTRPVLASRLLNRQLPPQIADLLEERRIKLFPRDWGDMRAKCSCPDWALPCKHIAAVIYLSANEIDKNPFLVFELHGMDLAAALGAATGVHLDALSNLSSFAHDWSTKPVISEFESPSSSAFDAMDLTSVPDLEARILTILTEAPLFHPRDFRKALATNYKRAARETRAFDQTAGEPWPAVERLHGLTTVVDGNGYLAEIRSAGKALFAEMAQRGSTNKLDLFLQQLQTLPPSFEQRLTPALRVWRSLLRFALKLLEQRAYVPCVLVNDDKETLIQWRPALLSEPVKALFEQLCTLCPPDLVVFEPQDSLQQSPHYSDAQTQCLAALNLLLGFFIRHAFKQSAESRVPDTIKRLFFAGTPARFDRFETEQHPRLIQHWLRRLTLGEREHRLHLQVDERDESQLAVTLKIEGKQGLQPIAQWLEKPDKSDARTAVLADLAVLADYYPDAEQLIDGQQTDEELVYSLQAFTPVFRDVLPALRMLGIGIMLPKALRQLARPQASLAIHSDGGEEEDAPAVSYLKLDQLLDFDWQIAVGDQNISLAEFRKLVDDASGIVRIKDQYVLVDSAEVKRLLDNLEAQPKALTSTDLLQAGLTGERDGAQVTLGERADALFDQLLHPRTKPALPDDLHADLRPYQKRGFEWLTQNAELGFGSLLADDMGLGKTLQVIAVLMHFKQTGALDKAKALVVVPTSLLTNWRKEIERFAPSLRSHIYHGPDRSLPESKDYDVLLTSYGLVRSDSKQLAKPKWRVLVIDEAQNIKNPATAQTKAVKHIKADIRIGMSGTPVENRLREYWSVFDFINPGYLRSQKIFARDFANPIERDRDQAALDKFRKLTAPFILRRLKTDKSIIADLPEKLEANRYCSLSARQASLYQKTVDSIMDDIKSMDEGIERRGLIFKLINALKQICNSPDQFLKNETASVRDSGKLAAFIEVMREAEAADEKALIFTQYTAMGRLLTIALQEEMGLDVPFLHGGRSRKQRDEMVDAFQNEGGIRAMVLSLKAGGTGLNLTAASQVIHYDLWWNPAVEQQATDRAYRIGQHRNVMVHRLITENTFEEKIDAMIQSKKKLAELTVASGEQWITELSNDDLRELVSL